jgi:two-component system, cell cycle response regulator
MASSKFPWRVGSSFPPDEGEATSITLLSDLQGGVKSPATVNAYLIVLQGSSVGAMFKLEGPDSMIGRGSLAAVRLNDDGVSRKHARIVRSGDQVYIEDLGSANGTMVNGDRVARHLLKDGDKIRIGSTTILKFTYHDNLEENFQQSLYEAAIRDGLTKLYNKKHFLDRLESEFAFAKRHKANLSLVIFDLDFFKKVNDNFGHVAGDVGLQGVAAIAQSLVRTEDVLARYGGEEFVILCRQTAALSAAILADRIRAEIAATPVLWENKRLPITVSMGVAGIVEAEVETATALLEAADKALYDSKRLGRNRVTMAAAKS